MVAVGAAGVTGVEGPLAIAALVVAVIALLVGTAGLIEARRADVKKSHPAPASSSAGQVTVPNVVGQTGVNAAVKIQGAKLKAKTVRQPSATVAKGMVMSQDPAAGAKVASETVVTLTVSDGPATASGSPPPRRRLHRRPHRWLKPLASPAVIGTDCGCLFRWATASRMSSSRIAARSGVTP